MTLFLIRHAKAGSRSDWDDDDRLRPLSNKGRVQADQLAVVLAAVAPSRLVSSPYLRCVQTLEPLGRLCDLEVVADERLAEDGPFEAVLELLADLPDQAVLCSHGDLIPETIDALVRRGCHVVGRPDWRKATVWRLERGATGEITTAEVTPPPS